MATDTPLIVRQTEHTLLNAARRSEVASHSWTAPGDLMALSDSDPNASPDPAQGSVVVCGTAIVAGVFIGLVGGAFRWCLQWADVLRVDLSDWAHRIPGPGWLVPMLATAIGAALAALFVRWMPLAAGSGIQHVEAVYRGDASPPALRLLPAKFAGGVLGIGSGLVLGREGPTVHMGAAIGAAVARFAHLADAKVRMLQTAVGGAGLAVAFNAPIGGVLFTLEEVTKSFRLQTVLATALAAATAVGLLARHHRRPCGLPARQCRIPGSGVDAALRRLRARDRMPWRALQQTGSGYSSIGSSW